MGLMRRTYCLWTWFVIALIIIVVYVNITNIDHKINQSVSPVILSHDYHKIRHLPPPPPVNNTVCKLLVNNYPPHKGYVIGLNYWEQLNMAVSNLYSLVRVAADWNGVVVKPFTSNSRLFGLPHLRADEKWRSNLSSLPISVLFDSSHFMNMPCLYNLHPLVDFDEFILKGIRYVTIFHFIFERDIREKPVLEGMAGAEIKERLKTDVIFVCDDILPIHVMKNDIIKSLNSEAKKHNSPPFKLLRYFCIDGSIQTTPNQLAKQTLLSETSFSLLVINWRGLRGSVTVKSSAKGEHKSQRQFITNTSSTNHPTALKNIVYPSIYVLNNASYFLADVSGGEEFVGIHIRSEKLGLRETRINDFVPLCLREAIKLRDQLRQSTRNQKSIVITDSGLYGSDSCKFCKGAKRTKEFLDVYGIKPVWFNPTRYHAPIDSGFVGLVEMNTLLQSQHLILVGGGAFQKQLAMRMRENIVAVHKGKVHRQVHMVCWDDQVKVKSLKLRTYHHS